MKKFIQLWREIHHETRAGSTNQVLAQISQEIEGTQSTPDELPLLEGTPLRLKLAASSAPFVYWANFRIPLSEFKGHSLTVGGTGSGKTLLTDRQIKSLVPICQRGSGNVLVIYDCKGTTVQLLEGEGCKDYILFNISDARGWGWDIATDYGQNPARLGEIAYKFAPSKKDGEPFFRDSARGMLKAVLSSLSELHPKWRLYWLYWLMQINMSHLDVDDESFLEAHSGNLVYLQLLWRTLQPKTISGILGELALLLDRLQPLFAHDAYAKKRFSLTKLLETGGVLVISMDLAVREVSEPAIHLLLDCLFDLINSRPDSEIKGRKGFLVLDEFPFLKTLPKIGSMLSFSRSKGWHVLLTAQSIEQLKDFYPVGELSSIIGNVDNLCLLKNNDPFMNKWTSEYFGQEERVEITVSESFDGSGSYTESEKVVIRPKLLSGVLSALPATSISTGIYCYLNSVYFDKPISSRFFIPAHDITAYSPKYDYSVPAFIPKPTNMLIPPLPSETDLQYIISGKRPEVKLSSVPDGIPKVFVELILQEVRHQARGLLDQLIVELNNRDEPEKDPK